MSRLVPAAMAAALLFVVSAPSLAEGPVPSAEASKHVGETVTVCGTVAGAAHFDRLKGEPTFLNFDRPYPDQTFTVVIWGDNNRKFESPPHRLFAHREICVTGTVETYRGKPQIEVRDPSQITVASTRLDADRFSYEERVLLKAVLAALGHPTDVGTGEWDEQADRALRAFQAEAGVTPEGDRDPATLRALAGATDRIGPDDARRILRLLLVNLAQREEPAAGK